MTSSLNIEKLDWEKPLIQKNSEKLTSKGIIGSFLFGDKPYSLRKKRHNYYLTDYQKSRFKIETLYLPTNNDSIDCSRLLLVDRGHWNYRIDWLAELLTRGKLFFGSKEEENKQAKCDFFLEHNKRISKSRK